MNRQQKESVVQVFNKNFEKSNGSFFVNYSGLTVVQMQQLRKQLRESGASMKIAKMRLVKRALGGFTGREGLFAYCKNQVGVVFAHEGVEASGVAKVLNDFAKKNQALSLVAGYFDAEVVDAAAIVRIALLPSKDVLLAQLCGAFKAPLIKLVLLLKEVQAQKEA